ncbi:NHL repeat-containing protein [Zavarzinella formosa]|uniref:NHL repeat-containing protein n=1 Tax=Zavarzinella formosa TaxID=360055 RepID=UPI0002F943C7|nr:NHL repeat-containing protein [Zavarzinella formosa]
MTPSRISGLLFAVCLSAFLGGCGTSAKPEAVWGQRGVRDGDFVRPRAAVIDGQDRLWVVDFTARVQAFDLDGQYLGPTFTTPDYRNGRPSGLGVTNDGRLMVCDSHYHTLRIYDTDSNEVQTIGGRSGNGPGEFGYLSDAVQDADGFFYVSEFGINERITKLKADGSFVKSWGKPGIEPGEFNRPRALALGPDGNLYVADGCNHRVQVFTRDGDLVRVIGREGTEPGELKYPYDLAFGPKKQLYVVERGNHRVQRFTMDGVSEGVWGGKNGRLPGQLADPWGLVVDKKGRVHVIDTENHRVQRIKF